MRLAAALMLACLLLAGCSDGAPGSGAATTASGSMTGTSSGPAGTGPGNVSLGAPAWQVGQSWEWSVAAQVLGVDLTVTTTVLSAGGGTYDVGVASAGDMAGVYPFHLVGTGAVDAATLAWQAHGMGVQLLRFPLVAGDQFTTDLWGAPGAQVLIEAVNVTGPSGLEPGFRSTASYAGGGTFLQADYAPSLGQFVRVATYFGGEQPFAEATLVGAAPAPQEPAAFRATDLGRIAAAAGDPGALAPVQGAIPDDADAILLACFMGGSQGPATAELTGGGTSGACAYDPTTSGIRPPYNWAYAPVQAGGPSILTGQVAAGSAVFEGFAIDTTP